MEEWYKSIFYVGNTHKRVQTSEEKLKELSKEMMIVKNMLLEIKQILTIVKNNNRSRNGPHGNGPHGNGPHGNGPHNKVNHEDDNERKLKNCQKDLQDYKRMLEAYIKENLLKRNSKPNVKFNVKPNVKPQNDRKRSYNAENNAFDMIRNSIRPKTRQKTNNVLRRSTRRAKKPNRYGF